MSERLARARRHRRRRDDGRRDLARLRLERHPDGARRQHGGAGRGGARALARAALAARGGRQRRRGRGGDGARERHGGGVGRRGRRRRRPDRRGRRRAPRREGRPSTRRSRRPPRDGAVIATNTSSIPIAELAAGLRRPARFLGVHWFVPPLLVPCVEVIPAACDGRAGRAAGRRSADAARQGRRRRRRRPRVRRQPDPVRDVQGGGQDRGGRPRHARAGRRGRALVVRLPAPVLRAVHDRRHGGARRLRGHLRDARARPRRRASRRPSILREHVARGDFGVKTGRGFLELSQAEADELVARRDRAYAGLARLRREVEV